MVSIVGPNGSGKSTLIKLVSNELNPSSGSIIIKNKLNNAWSISELSKFRAILSQSNSLSFPFTVLDIIKMGRYPFQTSEIINNKICMELIDLLDLNNHIDQVYTTLSGGEKQRVQLARVFAQIWSDNTYDDKILMLDEPTSFLDIKHQYSLFKILKSLNNKGLTIMMVLHDINHALSYSEKIIMLKDSNLMGFGKINEIINSEILEKLFNLKLNLIKDKKTGKLNISFLDS
tara:strand:- start:594 stop:1289 length:696 start_codon:yes stop_codon:yes gene_type:complete